MGTGTANTGQEVLAYSELGDTGVTRTTRLIPPYGLQGNHMSVG